MTAPRTDSATFRRGLGAVACFLAVALAFRHALTAIAIALAAWLLFRIVVRRDRRALLCLVSTALSIAAFEYVGGKVLQRKIAETFQPGIDHRLRPDPAHGINRDGIRCPVEADDFSADVVKIIMLGYSLTFGYLRD